MIMKKKWYRSGWMKAFVILLSYITIVTAVFCAVAMIWMRTEGISFVNAGQEFKESVAFRNLVTDNGIRIESELKAKIAKETFDTMEQGAFLDLGVFYQNGTRSVIDAMNPPYEKQTDLQYSMEDLREWAKNREDTDMNGYDMPILLCIREDGTCHYYYFEEFVQGVVNGRIQCELSNEYYDYYVDDDNGGYLNNCSESEIKDYICSAAFNDWNIGAVTDKNSQTEEQYVRCYANGGFDASLLNANTGIGEVYSPKGYKNILDYLNKNNDWDSLETVYQTLIEVLWEINSYTDSDSEYLSAYEDGKTNVTYLYAVPDEKKIYTNCRDYENYSNLEDSLKSLQEDSYYLIRSGKESVTNIEKLSEDNCLGALETHAGKISNAENYVFALQVDTKFPAADKLWEANEIYTKYAGLQRPALAGGILAVVLWLVTVIWLTVIAGRKPGDEEVHLNWFDSIYTEIAAAAVAGVWFGGMATGVNLCDIAQSARVEILGWIAVLVPFTQTMFLCGWLSLVRRIKAKSIWKNSLCRWCCKGLGRCFKGIRKWLNGMVNWCQAVIYGKDIVLDGLKRISGGELQYKIPLDKVNGKRKVMAEYINNIGDGLDNAVDKAMRSERMKTDLITNVSHDIKTPLTSIINYVDLLKRENFTDPKIQGYLQILDEKSQRLKILTEDVVEVSKASSGNINLEMTELDFVELIHQVLGELQEKFQEKNLTMMVHFEDEASVIRADGQRMWRVLSNIFGNVVKYAMEGTRVYAEVSNKNKKVIFTLKNISAQPLNISADELTERFIRGDISRNTEGSGLGLSIAKSLTELQGGEFKLFVDGDLFKVVITFNAVEKKENS